MKIETAVRTECFRPHLQADLAPSMGHVRGGMKDDKQTQAVRTTALAALSVDRVRRDAARIAVLSNKQRIESNYFAPPPAENAGLVFCTEPPLVAGAKGGN